MEELRQQKTSAEENQRSLKAQLTDAQESQQTMKVCMEILLRMYMHPMSCHVVSVNCVMITPHF